MFKVLHDRINIELRRYFSFRNGRSLDTVAKLWILVLSVVVFMTVDDYGVTWDEGYHVNYGSHIANFYGTGFENRVALTYRNDYLYGGGFDLIGALFRRTLAYSLDKYTGIHIFGAIIGIVGVIGTWKLGRLLGGSITGLLSVVFITLTPVYYGHMFNNPKDLPFAVGYIWSLYYILRIIRESPVLGTELALRTSLAIGLSMSVRIAGLLLPMMLLTGIGIESIARVLRNGSWETTYRIGRQHLLKVLGIVTGAWMLMLALWPWAMIDPIRRPIVALLRMSKFTSHRRKMPFDGEMISTLDVPPDYLLHYFGYKLPECLIIASIVGFGIVCGKLFFAPASRMRVAWGILIFATVFPPAYAVFKESPLYDGLRHFLFIVPVICVFGAVGLTSLLRAGRRWIRWIAISVVTGVMVGFSADQIHTMVMIHPHQYTWFNRFVGGLEEAVGLYDTDYYGESYKETLESLPPYLWEQDREKYLNSMFTVKGCLARPLIERYLPANFTGVTRKRRKYDFFTGYTRSRCMERHKDKPIIHEVVVQEATINVIRDMRKKPDPPKPDLQRGVSASAGTQQNGAPQDASEPNPTADQPQKSAISSSATKPGESGTLR